MLESLAGSLLVLDCGMVCSMRAGGQVGCAAAAWLCPTKPEQQPAWRLPGYPPCLACCLCPSCICGTLPTRSSPTTLARTSSGLNQQNSILSDFETTQLISPRSSRMHHDHACSGPMLHDLWRTTSAGVGCETLVTQLCLLLAYDPE